MKNAEELLKSSVSPILVVTPTVLHTANNLRLKGCKAFELNDQESDIWTLTNFVSALPLVVYDISRVKAPQLLKFIEEAKSRLICLSSHDGLDPVLLSRFMRVYKDARVLVPQVFDKSQLLAFLDKEEPDYSELVTRCANVYPLFSMYRVSRIPVKRKLIEFLL